MKFQNYKYRNNICIKIKMIKVDKMLIKKCQKYDKRIKLIKNNVNKGTFACRNLGILKSKGIYIMTPDPDDILLENTLRYFYYFSIKYNYEFIRFNSSII